MATPADLTNRFAYHNPPNESIVKSHEWVREVLHSAAKQIDAEVPEGREKALALTKIEEAMFWANAGIAREGSK